MSELTVEVESREETGKNASRRLRVAGLLPAVVYGGGKDPARITISQDKVAELLRTGAGENAIFLLKLAGTKRSRHTMIKELQRNPVNGKMIHIDFQRVNMKEAVKVSVPVELVGDCIGVKADGGILDFVTREIEIECLPNAIPQRLEADVEELHVGQHLEASALALPKGVELLTDPNRVVVSVAQSRTEEAEGEDDEAEGLLEAAKAEPEVAGAKAEGE
jgi:large subunit ribosomal protein L25